MMVRRKLWTKNFINILQLNLVSKLKYGISTMVIAEPLIQPCKATTMFGELAYTLSPVGFVAINDIARLNSVLK